MNEDVNLTAAPHGGSPALRAQEDELMSLIIRETNDTYRTPAERAAYRAGMSTSAAICDSVSAEIRKQRKHLTVAQSAAQRSATKCGDEIMKFRNEVHVLDEPRGSSASEGSTKPEAVDN